MLEHLPLNIKLSVNKKSNLVMLNTRIKNIDSIENIYVQDFNKEFMSLRIKYLGKLEKLINDLKKENINLKLINENKLLKHCKMSQLIFKFFFKKVL